MFDATSYIRNRDDTIVAVATPAAAARRGVLRVSGRRVASLLGDRLRGTDGPDDPRPLRREVRAGHLVLARTAVGLPTSAWIYPGPRSYTGEDLVEFHLPGNPTLLALVMDDLVSWGLRPAGPGEFTARAFFGGRIDLTRAEAVAALIAAEDEDERQAAAAVLGGSVESRTRAIAERLLDLLQPLELAFDFADQDVLIEEPLDLETRLRGIGGELEAFVEERAEALRFLGLPRVLLVGPANAGKSTLFNALVGEELALVSDRPGTTRDPLERRLRWGEVEFVLVDSAGHDHAVAAADLLAHRLREREREGAALVVEVIDSRRGPADEETGPESGPRVYTHGDLAPRPASRTPVFAAPTRAGLEDVRKAILAALERETRGAARALNRLAGRHAEVFRRVRAHIDRALADRRDGLGTEFLAAELHAALHALRTVTGADYDDDLLSRIMRDFCIGK